MDEKITKPNIRFTKDDEGKRIAQEISHEDIAAIPKKDIGIIVVGHIDHAKEQLLAALERSDFTGNILIVEWPEAVQLPGYEWLLSLEEQLKKMSKTPIIIQPIEREIGEVFFEQQRKPYTKDTARFVPKPQKSKAKQKRFQRKK